MSHSIHIRQHKRALHLPVIILFMDQYLQFATKLAHEAGEIMLEHFQIGVDTEIKKHEGNTPVTVADKAINKLVIDTVRSTFPTHAVLGEEESLEIEDAPYTWVCDPIDGTIPYSAGIPTNVFAIALVDKIDGQPKVAVVFDPYTRRLYSALQGKGAFVNGVRMQVNEVSQFANSIIGTSSQRSTAVNATQLKTSIIDGCFRQISLNCTIYEAMMVAAGQFAANVFVGAGAHDVVTTKLIVEEAGGKVTDLFGEPQRYDQPVHGAIVSNGFIHEELVKLARQNKL